MASDGVNKMERTSAYTAVAATHQNPLIDYMSSRWVSGFVCQFLFLGFFILAVALRQLDTRSSNR